MCGIAGAVAREGVDPSLIAAVRRMNNAQVHRGPDGEGEYHSRHALLASRRLSIVDVVGGAQPLYNESRSVVVVANGEIYNDPDLRRTLERSGHRFQTGSDCESIVQAYEEYGLDFVRHLRGMFAFALWDDKRRRLILGRDRMGERPLYLREERGALLFASEMKGLLKSGRVPFELDAQAVDHYFHYQFVPEPLTAIQGVRKLEAGHILTIDVDSWSVQDRCYWRMEDAPPIDDEPMERVRQKLDEVGRIVMRSDRPVGVALSGGLDSSLIATLGAKVKGRDLHLFTVGYSGHPPSDERQDARALADHLGLALQDIEVSTAEVVSFFPELNYWRDDPIADIAGHGYFAVMQLARQHGVPVMLQGQGGDELFWGYPFHRAAAMETVYKGDGTRSSLMQKPASLTRVGLGAWIRDAAGVRSALARSSRRRAGPPDRMIFYDRLPDFQAGTTMRRHYAESFAARVRPESAGELFTFPSPWPDVPVTQTRLACETYLRANGLAQADRLGMASGVESRMPLVDHEFVELVIGLRKGCPDLSLPAKARLIEGVRDLLPEFVLRRPKRGFEPPVREWHRALFAAHGHLLPEGFLVAKGVLRRESAVELSKGAFPPGETSPLSFKALVLEQWCREMQSRSQI